MVPRTALALLVVIAGCSTIAGPTERGTELESAVRTDQPTRDATPPRGVTERDTVEYADLSASRQRAFDAAIDGEASFLDEGTRESPYVDREYFGYTQLSPFRGKEYVLKDGTYYSLSIRQANLITSYRIHAARSNPPEHASTVDLSHLSSETRDPVRWAIENGSHSVPAGKWSRVPEPLHEVDYVEVENTTYRLTYSVGDSWVLVMRAERVG